MRIVISTAAVIASFGLAATSTWAQNTYIAVEGGLACSNGKTVMETADVKIGDNGCGGRGTIEVGRTGAQVYGILDHWALRGRLSDSKDRGSFVDGGAGVDVSFRERRTVLDAEVGAKTPFGMFGGVSRVTFGLRYGAWTGDVIAVSTMGDTRKNSFETSGFGPRIGMRSSIPLGTHWMYESVFGASALFSRGEGNKFENGVLTDATSSNGTVFSIDSLSLLSYKLNGTETGSVVSIGLASDYYFNQVPGESEKVNRYSFGPVARFRMPLP